MAIPYDEYIARLRLKGYIVNPTAGADEAMVQCPVGSGHAPGDPTSTPSQNVRRNNNGNATITCYGNCAGEDREKHYYKIMETLGLHKEKYNYPVTPKTTAQPHSDPPVVSTERSERFTVEEYAESKALDAHRLRQWGLKDRTDHVIMPYIDENGKEVATRYRFRDGRKTSRKGSKFCLYGIDRLGKADEVDIVEGESDCHTLWNYGFDALGLPGAGNWNEARDAKLLDRVGTINIVLEMKDGYVDGGGEAVIRWLRRSVISNRVFIITCDGYNDPSDLHLSDPENFQRRWDELRESATHWDDWINHYDNGRADELRNEYYEIASDIIESPNIVQRVVDHLEGRLQGEESAVRQLVVIFNTLNLEQLTDSKAVSCLIEGVFSTGKSYLVESVLDMFPPERWVHQDSMSNQAISYMGDKVKDMILFISEKTGLSSDSEDIWHAVRQMITGGKSTRAIVQDGELKQLKTEGPTVVCMTTTGHLDAETDSRLIKIATNDSQALTEKVTHAQDIRVSQPWNYESLDNSEWHAFHKWLALGNKKVVIPYMPDISHLKSSAQPVMRRINTHFNALIMSHAHLHQANREVEEHGYIVATLEDYQAVVELFNPSMAVSVDEDVKRSVRRTVEAVMAIRLGPKEPVTINELTEYMGIDKSNVLKHVQASLYAGYLISERKGGGPHKLIVDRQLPTGDERPFPTVDEVILATGEEVLV